MSGQQTKDSRVKYIVGRIHSFLSVEHEWLLNLAQTGIRIDNETGNIQVNAIWYGRKTVRVTALAEFNKFTLELKPNLTSPIAEREVAACTYL